MAETKQRRDYGSGSISQKADGTWTARMVIGVNEKGKPRIKALYGKTEREVKKKLKDFQKEFYKNDQTVVQRSTVESYMRTWLYENKQNLLKPKSFDRLEQTVLYQVIPQVGHIQLAAFQSNDVQTMLNTLKKNGLSYSSVKKAYDAVNECFRTGVIQKTVLFNPALGVAVPAKKTFGKTEIRYYDDNALFEIEDRFIYSNQWIPLSTKCTIQEKLRLSAVLDEKCSGGSISHINLEANFPNTDVAWDMLNKIAQSGVIYFAFNTRINECENHHGFVGTEHCPVCGEPVYDTYQRIVGYLVPTRSYSKERFREFTTRQWYEYAEMVGE